MASQPGDGFILLETINNPSGFKRPKQTIDKMEEIITKGIKVPNAVIVSGATGTADDEKLIEDLQKHGSISNIVNIQDPISGFHQDLIVEFSNGSAMQSLEPMLPYTYKLTDNPEITYVVKSLSDVYTKHLGGDATRSYLKGLREIAMLSGVNFETMLSEMLTEMSSAVLPSCAETGAVKQTPENLNQDQPEIKAGSSETTEPHSVEKQQIPSATFCVNDTILTSPTVLNPPDIQRLVVEHVVRTEEANTHALATTRLRVFSGRIPRPVNEIEYDTWHTSVDFILKDPTISSFHGSRKILDSLLPPASDIVKHLGPEATPSEYMQLLDSAFGTVEDGDELLAKFMNTLQNAGEKPSVYLSRLQAALTIAVKRGGALSSEANRQLLRQFCRGCWDNNLIADLGLEQKRNNPPSFAQLLLMLRTEEDKYAAKEKRMRQHLAGTKQRVQVHAQRTWVVDEARQSETSDVLSIVSETKELRKQIATLQSQLAKLTPRAEGSKKCFLPPEARKGSTVENKLQKPNVESVTAATRKQMEKPRPWYCFKCGEDGHIVASCTAEPNPKLVAEKRKLLRERQFRWESQNTAVKDLN